MTSTGSVPWLLLLYIIANFAVFLDGVHQLNKTLADNELPKIIREKRQLVQLPKNGILFEGDILMDDRFRAIIRSGGESKKSALVVGWWFNVRWPDGVVHYKADHTFSLWHRLILAKTIHQFERRTCIRFKQRTYQRDYIMFTSKRKGCFSTIGRKGGRQYINLEQNCVRLGTFEHEILHALGMIHEHSRPDRDQFIKVKYENVKPSDLNNFQKYPYYEVDELDEEFNFASVMMYPNKAFTRNGHNTIVSRKEPYLQFGQRSQLSVGDVRAVNRFYKCRHYLEVPDYAGLVKNYHTGAGKRVYKLGWFDYFMEWLLHMLEPIHLVFLF